MGKSLRPSQKAAVPQKERKSKQTGPNKPHLDNQTHPNTRLPKAGQDNFRSVSSIWGWRHPQIPTNPIAHSVSLTREGLKKSPRGHHVLPTPGGCGGLKG